MKPKLSPKGQAWVEKTFVLLQEAIEHRLNDDREDFDRLERNNGRFRRFAYDTHSRAYLEAGLHELPVEDLWEIVKTPDLGDLMTQDGVRQVIETGIGLVPQWSSDAMEKIDEEIDDTVDWAKEQAEEAMKAGGKAVDWIKERLSDD